MSAITHFFVIHFARRTLAKHPDRIIHAIEPQKTHLTLFFLQPSMSSLPGKMDNFSFTAQTQRSLGVSLIDRDKGGMQRKAGLEI